MNTVPIFDTRSQSKRTATAALGVALDETASAGRCATGRRTLLRVALAGLALLSHATVSTAALPGIPQCGPNQSCPPGGGGGGNPGQCTGNPNGNPGCNGGGNPINFLTGNKYQHEVDLAPLPGVLGLRFERHYNSGSRHRGLTGTGWRSSFEMVLVDSAHDVQIIDADGTRRTFAKDPKDPSQCVTARPEDGRVLIEQGTRSEPRSFRWQRLDGTEYVFADGERNAHPLQSIRAASGETLRLTYAGGALDSVVDAQGRKLTFIYGRAQAAGSKRYRMLLLTAIDTPVGRVSYEHDEQGRLVMVTQADGLLRRYHYEPEHQSGDPDLLTGISLQYEHNGKPSVQRIATYQYDAQGRGIRTQHLGGDDLKLAYDDKSNTTTVIPQSGPQRGVPTVYRRRFLHGDWVMAEARGPGCDSCAPSNIRYSYNANGQVQHWTQLDSQGRPLFTERTQHDALGRTLAVTREPHQAGAGRVGVPRLLQRAEYAAPPADMSALRSASAWAALWLPRLLARPSVVPGQEHILRIEWNAQLQPVRILQSGFRPAGPQAQGELVGGFGPVRQQARPLAIERSTSFRYGEVAGASRLVAVDGPLAGTADTTTLHYDERGRLRLVQHPLPDLQERFAYDSAGRNSLHVPTDAVPLRLSYAASGALLRWERAGAVVAVERDARGRPTRIDLPDGETIVRAYDDALGLSADVTNRGWAAWEPTRADAARALLTLVGPEATAAPAAVQPPASAWGAVDAQYDDFGRLVSLRTATTGEELRVYDAADRLIERRFADGNVWRYARDAAGRVLAHTVSAPWAGTVTTRIQW